MKQGDLSDDRDGVHVPDSGTSGTDRHEEPIAQESEDPYERGHRVTQRVPPDRAKGSRKMDVR